MSSSDFRINLWEIVSPLAKTVDMMSPDLAEHHMRVAYLALRIAEQCDVPAEERRDIVIAAALHDIGAFSLQERLDILEFEEKSPMRHAIAGHLLLKDFDLLGNAAEIIRYHHLRWLYGKGEECAGAKVPRGSHIVHLADRVAVLMKRDKPILGQTDTICRLIREGEGAVFAPHYAEAMRHLADKDYIWLEATSNWIEPILRKRVWTQHKEIDLDGLLRFSELLCHLIDFKSPFTASHSSGVAASAVELGKLAGFSSDECIMLRIAANLHDLGKLAIPSELIEKNGKLTDDEWQTMRTHVYYTYHVLDPIEALSVITSWGALHQERLDGSGYPFSYGANDLTIGSRIMAVADIFTAITEDRPYRKGMDKDAAISTLQNMVAKGEIDGNLVNLIQTHYDSINAARAEAQQAARTQYSQFINALQ